ncbi:MAG: ABC transporter permease [Conexibacter sp.]
MSVDLRRAAVSVLVTAVAIAGGLLCGMAILAVAGKDVQAALDALWTGSLATPQALHESMRQAIPITIAGIGVAFALRAGLFNIGANGQIYMGALAAVLVGLYVTGLPAPLVVLLALLAGAAGGGLWGALPGVMRSRRAMNEVITTLLLNFVAFWLVSWAVHGPLLDSEGGGTPWTRAVGPAAQLGDVAVGSLHVPVGLLITFALAALTALVVNRTALGFELRLVGDNAAAAQSAGVPTGRRIVQAMAISGLLAGVAGAVELIAFQHRLSDFFSPSYGFTAIAVALVGNGRVLGTVLAGLFFGALQAGAASMEAIAQIPAAVSLIVQGAIVIVLVAARAPVVMARIERLWRRPAQPARASVARAAGEATS